MNQTMGYGVKKPNALMLNGRAFWMCKAESKTTVFSLVKCKFNEFNKT